MQSCYAACAGNCKLTSTLYKELHMKKLLLIALTSMAVLSACNTISGAGKDISAAGHAVTDTAQEVKQAM
ncbi:ECN family pore-forming entericidin [Kingella kingae ATCC 23330]|uniref:ECN family pore-forming entericidin n=2 Tax=Kingella kingae TaxID=504 RepID=F5S8B0_KINKI|nr:ECN family pore-forming entericidin [Kingella kingae ATCC 23330]